ncbi:hypothetical protein EVAR_26949_1 [Eumeta japonica]|uniref:Uncharacterized protein n=1 Tax=Eumeta variegata TaxID=151549 RepID=A0A4C1VKN5_EUMVA|nr:hypothetical protein EVAR_26949_1 [Eumeta japonica]
MRRIPNKGIQEVEIGYAIGKAASALSVTTPVCAWTNSKVMLMGRQTDGQRSDFIRVPSQATDLHRKITPMKRDSVYRYIWRGDLLPLRVLDMRLSAGGVRNVIFLFVSVSIAQRGGGRPEPPAGRGPGTGDERHGPGVPSTRLN